MLLKLLHRLDSGANPGIPDLSEFETETQSDSNMSEFETKTKAWHGYIGSLAD